ncbi:MAG: hypothetical protein ACLFP8_07590 [Alphaproteobacteria bacterium]
MNICEMWQGIERYFNEAWVFLSNAVPAVLNSNFSIAATGSAFGAFGGAYCLWLINKKREREHSLSQINTVLALLIAHMNSLLNFKKQHVLPFNEEMNNIIEKIRNPGAHAQNNILEVEAYQIFKHVLEMGFDVNGITENLSPYAYKDSKSLLLAVKVKEALLSVTEIKKFRNGLVKIIQNNPSPAEVKIPFYLGELEVEGRSDSTFKDSTEGLLFNVDVALHFIDLLIPRVQKIGQMILPKSYSKKIIKNEIIDGYAELVPPKDFIKGWED